jgi:hypothetical protein
MDALIFPLQLVFYCACAGAIIYIAISITRQLMGLVCIPVIIRQNKHIIDRVNATHNCCHGDFAKLTTLLQSHTTTLGTIQYMVSNGPITAEEPLALQKPCAVCKGAEVTHIVWPCAHLCLCGECAAQSEHFHNKCPMCTAVFQTIGRVYC